jgi:acetyltransferase-like isoleucine patch superfamily enzyme
VKILGTCRVAIGEDTFIGHDVLIGGGDCNIVIGNCVDIAPRVVVVAGSHEIDMLGEHSAGRGISRGITIEDGAWIGAGAVIIGGVRIGNKAIIGAGSVVVHDIPPYTVAMGNPCRPAKIWDAQTNRWNCTRQRSTTIEDRK